MMIDSFRGRASSAERSHFTMPLLLIKPMYDLHRNVMMRRPTRAPKRPGNRGDSTAPTRVNTKPAMPKTASEPYNTTYSYRDRKPAYNTPQLRVAMLAIAMRSDLEVQRHLKFLFHFCRGFREYPRNGKAGGCILRGLYQRAVLECCSAKRIQFNKSACPESGKPLGHCNDVLRACITSVCSIGRTVRESILGFDPVKILVIAAIGKDRPDGRAQIPSFLTKRVLHVQVQQRLE